MMTLEKFRATRQPIDDIGEVCSAEFYDEAGAVVKRAGFIYDSDCYIEKNDDGTLLLQLYREGYVAPLDRIDELELRLYEWALTERLWEDYDAEEATAILMGVEFAERLERAIGYENFAAMREANAAEPNDNVCHSHDYCDANVIMDEAVTTVMRRNGIPVDEIDWTMKGDERIGLMNRAWAAARPLLWRTAS
jgi:hypothetical protein